MNRVKSTAFKMAVFACTLHVVPLSKFFFHQFNFHCRLDKSKYFNTQLFPNLQYFLFEYVVSCPTQTQLVLKVAGNPALSRPTNLESKQIDFFVLWNL